jgi:ribonuclease BN (tRNA processing enzyme)
LTEHLDALALAHGDFIRDPGFPLEVVELSPGVRWLSGTGSFSVEAYATRHTDASLAFRIRPSDAVHGTVGYTGDTGPDASLGSFMSGCDLLIAECSLPDSGGMDIHLAPASVAEVARVAEPVVLVTVHVYPPLSPEDIPDLVSREGYTGRVLAGRDGMHFLVGRGDVTLLDQGP